MSILLTCRGLSKSYGARPLFENLTFGLADGERTGLIGPNGAGKSTLLKILAGAETPDCGELSLRRGLRIGYLSQQSTYADIPAASTVRQEIVKALSDIGLEPYEIEMRADTGMAQAGFTNPDRPVRELSGGWRKRLAILSQVLRRPDLLLLDEPTNHLDLEGVLWLENFMSGLDFPFLVVTHDRRFLERVCNRVIELNKCYENGHFSSSGNYSQFLENREILFDIQTAQEAATRNKVRREIEWLRRGPKARTTKQKARIDRAGELMRDLGELQFRNAQTRAVDIEFSASGRQTKKLIECKKTAKELGGKKLFSNLDLILCPGDKLGLLGENGSGKSTLLKVLSGALPPDSGTVTLADGLRTVIFDQHRQQLDLSLTLREALCPKGDFVMYRERPLHVAAWAGRFLFRKEQLEMPLGTLSGGEQSRVLIANLMLRPADVLMLDEPTNDLDLNSLEVLEESLREFAGALVLVTHDRYLMDSVCDNILALDGKGNTGFYADTDQWQERAREKMQAASAAKTAGQTAPAPALSRKEQKELLNIEEKIRSAEQQAETVRSAMDDPAVSADAAELMKRHEAYEAAQKKVDELYKRWEELEALKSGTSPAS